MPSSNHADTLVVLTTITDIDKGKQLARQIISNHLAACCNIVPQITSVYYWQNELCEDQECLLVMKTARHRFNELNNYIHAQHPYETPEIIAIPITAGSQEYLSWVMKETS